MNWSSWLGSLLRPSSRKRKRSRSAAHSIPVPKLLRNRVNSTVPRFSGAASEPDVSVHSQNVPKASRMSLAFTPAQPVSDLRQFAGRAELLRSLIRAIEDRRMHVVLYGDRGIGKTSLLHILTLLAREARYLVRYTSCSEDSEFDEVFRSAAADIPLLFHREYDPTSIEAEQGRSLADTFGDRPLTPASLSEALAKIAGTRILLILDEFDRAQSPAFRKSVADLIKNLSDRSARVQVVIGGVAANLTELIEHIPSIRRNVLGMSVGPMNDEEILQIIANAQAIGQVTFDQQATSDLLAIGNGSPYLVNLIGQQAGGIALARGTSLVSAADVDAATGDIEGEFRERLSVPALEQLLALEKNLPSDLLRPLGRYSQHHFGQLLPDHNAAVAAALKAKDDKAWWSDAGEFRFADDTIPVVLGLSNRK